MIEVPGAKENVVYKKRETRKVKIHVNYIEKSVVRTLWNPSEVGAQGALPLNPPLVWRYKIVLKA